jgi:hypothetical protein
MSVTGVACYAQDASWLKRTWEGRAYLLGANPQSYKLVLTINSVKGKNFEGVMRTIQPSDPSVYFDTKISGSFRDRQLVIEIGTWKVKCNTCKPQTLGYSIESGRFFLKGEAKGCSVECTWIAEFSEEIDQFNGSQKDILYALAGEEKITETDTTALVQNPKPPLPDTVSSSPETTSSVQRIPVLPSGNIAFREHNTALLSPQKLPGSLQKTPSLMVKEIAPATERIIMLPAGDIVSSGRNNALQLTHQPTVSLEKSPLLIIQQNTPPEQRTTVLPAGSITSSERDTTLLSSRKPGGTLPDKSSSLNIRQTIPALQKPSATPDTVSALPEGYAERKKNVIRTLIVNTDSILLRVYDNGIVDGDIASVIYNDKVVVDKLSLTSRAVEIKIPVTRSGINTLVFHAHNLGEFPPNTAKLEILYGDKKEELTVSSDLTVSSVIDIEYRQ